MAIYNQTRLSAEKLKKATNTGQPLRTANSASTMPDYLKTSGTVQNIANATASTANAPRYSMPKVKKQTLTNPTYNPGTTVNTQSLYDRMKQQSTFTPVQTIQQQFNTPQGVSNYAAEIQKSLQPQLDQQYQQINQTYDKSIADQLRQLNTSGNLESGVRADQERLANMSRAQSLQKALADMQANSVNLGLQYGNLGLQEGSTLFNQNMQNQQMVSSEDQRAIQNLQQALGMDISQNQWSQDFGLNRQNADRNWNLQQGQFGLDQDRFRQDVAVDGRNFNYGAGQDAFKNNLAQQQLANQVKQDNLTNALQLSQLYGTTVMPKQSGQELYNQVVGRQTLPATESQRNYDLQKLNSEQNYGLAADDNARGWANLGFEQEKYGYDQQIDSAKSMQDGKQNAYKYFDSIKVGQKDPETDELIQVDLGPQGKANLKAHFDVALGAILSQGGDPFVTLQKNKQALYQKYGTFEGNHIYNALTNIVGSMRSPK